MDCWFRSSLAFVLAGGVLIGVGGCDIRRTRGRIPSSRPAPLQTDFPVGQAHAGGEGAGQEDRGRDHHTRPSGSIPSS